jgi:hypothetical protein
MSRIDYKQGFDRAVDLIIKQDDVVDSWTARYIGVESGIAIAIGVILGWKGVTEQWVITGLVVLLAVLAIVFSFLMSAAVNRHLAWQCGYIESVKQIEGEGPLLYREGMIDKAEGTRLSSFYKSLRWVLLAVWVVFIVVILVAAFQGHNAVAAT